MKIRMLWVQIHDICGKKSLVKIGKTQILHVLWDKLLLILGDDTASQQAHVHVVVSGINSCCGHKGSCNRCVIYLVPLYCRRILEFRILRCLIYFYTLPDRSECAIYNFCHHSYYEVIKFFTKIWSRIERMFSPIQMIWKNFQSYGMTRPEYLLPCFILQYSWKPDNNF